MAEMGQSLALFVDFENLALGFAGTRKRFEIDKVLDRLVTKGKILVKKAYADWTRFGDYRRELHESSIELIEIPKRSQVGKNSADIRLCVDALDLCYSKAHIDTFCILSGDSDFSPLVSKLRENGKSVIGVGMKASTSSLLVEGCDEFIYYEDMERHEKVNVSAPVAPSGTPGDRKAEALQLVMDTVSALKRDGRDVLWGSLVKDTIKRRKPQFDHTYHGYRTWSELLEDAQRRGLMSLTIDSKSGTYVISSFSAPQGGVPAAPAGTSPVSAPAREFPRRDNGGGRHGWSREAAQRESAQREAAPRDAAAREAAAKEATARDLAAREAAIQAAPVVPLPEAAALHVEPAPEKITEMFLSMPVAPSSDPGLPPVEPAPQPVPEELPAETGAELPSEASRSGAGSDTAVIAQGKDTGTGAEAASEGPVRKGVRARGRSSVKKGTGAKRPKRGSGD